jgi:hypothetical protein
MAGRDLIMQTMDDAAPVPAAAPIPVAAVKEQPHSVYVVRTSSEESTRIVLEIKIHHEKK